MTENLLKYLEWLKCSKYQNKINNSKFLIYEMTFYELFLDKYGYTKNYKNRKENKFNK